MAYYGPFCTKKDVSRPSPHGHGGPLRGAKTRLPDLMHVLNCHFSVDDVLLALLEVSRGGGSPADHPFFQFLVQVHEEFEIDVDLYLFREIQQVDRAGSLTEVSSHLRDWFQQNPWLRFGPHAQNHDTRPHDQPPDEQQSFCEATYADIERFAGPGRTSRWVRLHYFSESYELATYLRSRKVEALLTTDKPAVSYRLPSTETEQLRVAGAVEFAGIRFVRSHVRIEALVGNAETDAALDMALRQLCPARGCTVVFTHEYELVRPEVRDMTWRVLSWLRDRG